MGSRRAGLIRPVRELVDARKKGKIGADEFLEEIHAFSPEQRSLLKVELEREAQGLGPSESVARKLRSMSVRGWGRAVGIAYLMNENVTNPRERVELLRSLAYSNVLTPIVLAQVMLLAGNGVIRKPGSVLPRAEGLAPVTDIEALSDPAALPYFPRR